MVKNLSGILLDGKSLSVSGQKRQVNDYEGANKHL